MVRGGGDLGGGLKEEEEGRKEGGAKATSLSSFSLESATARLALSPMKEEKR